jgi:hypothetical protein
MEQATTQRWFLRKHEDASVFGPVSLEQLERWASTAQIAPHDSLSIDQINWTKAPMLPQLAMDWLVEVTSERFYGPTTLGAIQEFIRLGDIDGETFIINACDGNRLRIREMPALVTTAVHQDVDLESAITAENIPEPEIAGMSIAVQERIRDLEQSLAEERRALQEAEQRYLALEEKYNELARQLA